MKAIINTVILMGLLSFFSCFNKNADSNSTNNDTIKLSEIVIDTSEGFCDISLQIISDTEKDKSHIYLAKGLYKNQPVGFQVEINSTAEPGIVNGEINTKAFIREGLKLTSTGNESDNYAKVLAKLYGIPSTKGFSQKPIIATIFNLSEFDGNLRESKYYKFKVFFEEDNEELYSEAYININKINGFIDFYEKDIEYRKPLIDVLTQ